MNTCFSHEHHSSFLMNDNIMDVFQWGYPLCWAEPSTACHWQVCLVRPDGKDRNWVDTTALKPSKIPRYCDQWWSTTQLEQETWHNSLTNLKPFFLISVQEILELFPWLERTVSPAIFVEDSLAERVVASKEKAMILLKNMSIAELIECLVSHASVICHLQPVWTDG